MDDYTLTLYNAQHFCMLLCNRLPNLKNLSFAICDPCWNQSSSANGKNKSTKHIIDHIHFLVDHLQQLVSLCIFFISWDLSELETACFLHLIRCQLDECPLSRPYRIRCSSEMIQIWL